MPRCDSTDGKEAALYPEDPGSNPVVGMKNMCHAAAGLMRLWCINKLNNCYFFKCKCFTFQ